MLFDSILHIFITTDGLFLLSYRLLLLLLLRLLFLSSSVAEPAPEIVAPCALLQWLLLYVLRHSGRFRFEHLLLTDSRFLNLNIIEEVATLVLEMLLTLFLCISRFRLAQ